MITININGYLTQSKLSAALKGMVGNWIGNEIKIDKYKYRWDMAYCQNNIKTIVEFDGDGHYRDSLWIRSDNEKDKIANDHGYSIIHFPYWVQLTDETLKYYFGLEARIIQDFPHGFITTKFFPASFCELGIKRFMQEFYKLPLNVQIEVTKSIDNRIREYGIQYVLPKSLIEINFP